jgi:uncharacterized protein
MNVVPPFTDSHAVLLQTFLSSPQRPQGTMTYPELAGFVFSMANSPELILPSEWLPMVFDDQEAGYRTPEEAERVLEAMMALYNDCARERTEASALLPPGCDVRPHPMDNLDAEAPLSQWARGFLTGHFYQDDLWTTYTPGDLDEELGAMLMVLTFFSSPALAEGYRKEGKGKFTLERMATTVVKLFPNAIWEYAHLARSIYQARREAGDLGQAPVAGKKVGRNDPCPCGSGNKFKKCCGRT